MFNSFSCPASSLVYVPGDGRGGECWFCPETSTLYRGVIVEELSCVLPAAPVQLSASLVLCENGQLLLLRPDGGFEVVRSDVSRLVSGRNRVVVVDNDGAVRDWSRDWSRVDMPDVPVSVVTSQAESLWLFEDRTLRRGYADGSFGAPEETDVIAATAAADGCVLVSKAGTVSLRHRYQRVLWSVDIDAVDLAAHVGAAHDPKSVGYMAVDRAGCLWTWGDNRSSRLGLGRRKAVPDPTVVLADVDAVTVMPQCTLVSAAGRLLAAGDLSGTPLRVDGSDVAAEIHVGYATLRPDPAGDLYAYNTVRRAGEFVPVCAEPGSGWAFVRATELFGQGGRYRVDGVPASGELETFAALLEAGWRADEALAATRAVLA